MLFRSRVNVRRTISVASRYGIARMSKRFFLRMFFWRMDGSFGKTLEAVAISHMAYDIWLMTPLSGHLYCFSLRRRQRALAAVKFKFLVLLSSLPR